MTAPRLDLGELRRLTATPMPPLCGKSEMGAHGRLLWSVYVGEVPSGQPIASFATHEAARLFMVGVPALPALLSIAEAAEAWLERGSTLDTHAALRAALAAVRKEEKGD